jgi:hypothetical protein
MSGACQAIGVLLLLLLIAFSFVPAYHVGKLLASAPRLNYTAGRVKWQWLPLVLPSWMLSFSLMVVAAKWVVIGRYKAQQVSFPSVQSLRWWIIDRLVHIWEIFVGKIILDTPLINLFYFLLGARLHPLAQIDAFVREFDMVEIGAYTKLQYTSTAGGLVSGMRRTAFRCAFVPFRLDAGARSRDLSGQVLMLAMEAMSTDSLLFPKEAKLLRM